MGISSVRANDEDRHSRDVPDVEILVEGVRATEGVLRRRKRSASQGVLSEGGRGSGRRPCEAWGLTARSVTLEVFQLLTSWLKACAW